MRARRSSYGIIIPIYIYKALTYFSSLVKLIRKYMFDIPSCASLLTIGSGSATDFSVLLYMGRDRRSVAEPEPIVS